MKIIATRHLNLHSKKVDGGLVHVPAKQPRLVPDDVANHPLFKRLVSSGTVIVLKGKKAPEALPLKQNTLPGENPSAEEDKDTPETLIPEDDMDEIIAEDDEENDGEGDDEDDEDDEEEENKPTTKSNKSSK